VVRRTWSAAAWAVRVGVATAVDPPPSPEASAQAALAAYRAQFQEDLRVCASRSGSGSDVHHPPLAPPKWKGLSYTPHHSGADRGGEGRGRGRVTATIPSCPPGDGYWLVGCARR
jgi:hypothetical protein